MWRNIRARNPRLLSACIRTNMYEHVEIHVCLKVELPSRVELRGIHKKENDFSDN